MCEQRPEVVPRTTSRGWCKPWISHVTGRRNGWPSAIQPWRSISGCRSPTTRKRSSAPWANRVTRRTHRREPPRRLRSRPATVSQPRTPTLVSALNRWQSPEALSFLNQVLYHCRSVMRLNLDTRAGHLPHPPLSNMHRAHLTNQTLATLSNPKITEQPLLIVTGIQMMLDAERTCVAQLLMPVYFSRPLAGFSVVSDSQGGDFVSGVLPFSEDSNSQGSEGPVKRLKTVD